MKLKTKNTGVHPLSQNYQIWCGWGACNVGVSHTSHPKRAEFPNFGVILYFCRHSVTPNDQKRHGITYGEGAFMGRQPHHCICTNVSRGLSATAEFFCNGVHHNLVLGKYSNRHILCVSLLCVTLFFNTIVIIIIIIIIFHSAPQ